MKKNILIIISALSIATANAQDNQFSLTGSIQDEIKPKKAYIQYNFRGNSIVDSTAIQNGYFTFKGATDGYTMGRLFFAYSDKGYTDRNNKLDWKALYLEPTNIRIDIKDSLKTSSVQAGKLNKDFLTYMNMADSLNNRVMDIRRAAAKDMSIRSNISKLIEAQEGENTKAFQKYATENPNSFFSLDAITFLMNKNIAPDILDNLFSKVNKEYKETRIGQQLSTSLASHRLTALGTEALLFTQNDVNGKPVNIKDYRGKYLLIDFWASWCVPCRQENPHLVKAYAQYKEKGFEILGVSLDNEKQKEAWLKAIQDDGLLWTQVSDLQGWKNQAATLYGIRSIPSSFLIDPQGKIIAKNLRGNKLDQKLREIFSK